MLRLWFNPDKNWFEIYLEDGAPLMGLGDVKILRDETETGTGTVINRGTVKAQFEVLVKVVNERPIETNDN